MHNPSWTNCVYRTRQSGSIAASILESPPDLVLLKVSSLFFFSLVNLKMTSIGIALGWHDITPRHMSTSACYAGLSMFSLTSFLFEDGSVSPQDVNSTPILFQMIRITRERDHVAAANRLALNGMAQISKVQATVLWSS